MAFVSPSIPPITPAGISDFTSSWGALPLVIDVSPLVLVVLAVLVGIFLAAMTVILIYHWRRFPFEHDIFKLAERVYVVGMIGFLALAVLGILFS